MLHLYNYAQCLTGTSKFIVSVAEQEKPNNEK